VTISISYNFYYQGAHLGSYSQIGLDSGRYSQIGRYFRVSAAAGAPCQLSFVWDATNQMRSALVTTTDHVILDSFTFTNGIFYPVASSEIEASNRRTKEMLQH